MMRLFRRAAAPIVRAPKPAAAPQVLTFGDRDIPLELTVNARARRLTLRADAVRGVVRVTVPPRGSRKAAMSFVEAHREWIAVRVARWPVPLPFVPGALVPFDGGTLRLDWNPDVRRGVVRDGERLVIGGDLSTLSGRVTRWLRAAALDDMSAATRRIAAEIGRPVSRVSIRDPGGRWGSCSASGAIGYSWRLILCPAEVRFSVVAHEVAHLVHANHGSDFWALAAQLNGGDPGAQRRWLARHGAGLHWVGRAA